MTTPTLWIAAGWTMCHFVWIGTAIVVIAALARRALAAAPGSPLPRRPGTAFPYDGRTHCHVLRRSRSFKRNRTAAARRPRGYEQWSATRENSAGRVSSYPEQLQFVGTAAKAGSIVFYSIEAGCYACSMRRFEGRFHRSFAGSRSHPFASLIVLVAADCAQYRTLHEHRAAFRFSKAPATCLSVKWLASCRCSCCSRRPLACWPG